MRPRDPVGHGHRGRERSHRRVEARAQVASSRHRRHFRQARGREAHALRRHAHAASHGGHGGGGAIYVYLKKQR